MVDVTYSARILCDSHFFEWLKDHPDRRSILLQLMYIKASSLHHRREHNVMLDFDFKTLSDNEFPIDENGLQASVKKVCLPSWIENDLDEFSKRVKYAIDLSRDKPQKTYIFTNPSKEQDYKTNPHLSGIISTEIKVGEDALQVIRSFFRLFKIDRDAAR